MEWSCYVAKLKCPKSYMLFKSITDTLFEISDYRYKKINEYINNDDSGGLDEKDKKIISELYINGFLVDDKNCEALEVKKTYIDEIENECGGTVYFAPSFKCNFNCIYCIIGENVSNISAENQHQMSDERSNQAAIYVYENAINYSLNSLNVILYGGEPLLSYSSIISFIRTLNAINKSGIRIRYTLVTNGYYMPIDKIDKLVKNGVDSLQVTLDGPEHIHNKRRMLISGKETFNTILDNIKNNYIKFKYNTIRINVDSSNANYICELIDILKERGFEKRCLLHFNLVDPSDYSDISGYNQYVYDCFKEIYKYAFESGFNVAPWRRHCSIGSKMYISIDKDGKIYYCPNVMGDDRGIVGNINTSHIKRYERKMRERCMMCEFLGICNGGCDVMRNTSKIGKDYCFREANEEMTKHYYCAKHHYMKSKKYSDF